MGTVMFYHLTRSSAEQTARVLISRAMAQGWRLMIRGTQEAELNRLDARLWATPEVSFLPHGREGGPHDRRQPLLIGTGPATNGAQGIILIDGAEVEQSEAERMERVWILFDADNPDRLTHARGQWKRLTDAGLPAQYWSEESGKWEKKAEKG
ncbi:MAG: DNA polymerase III subunit chi [Pseudotabrizicola sp.]|uniref:DNA polymerase III subunit chi n=1 Tax=Pseudotabrizicola sp. TaxID=2939647 RepID=UPI00271B05A0|nr:DNA polymerase III subunit chi [Pseudotabrizicola sp.]MDO8885037.1 DNA polymerase III subunit chi [Pseudotabrizicola sp.]MDP2082783.1 DNA polymerase III subunit chi [Pseudotabrizicola sp.]MDZ7576244.1 DNA polymerase III subunit chi [Pseudotabrizicola sp.]